MAISFIDGTYTHAGSSSGDTGTEPTGAAENDLIIAIASIQGSSDGLWTDPADFTEIDNLVASTGATSTTYAGYKVRGSTSGSGYAFSYSGTASGTALSLMAFRGIDTSAPLDVTYVRASHYTEGANDPQLAAAAITTVTNGAWVVLLQHMAGENVTASGAPSGYTVVQDEMTGNPLGRGHFCARKELATAGLETPGDFTHTDDGVNPVGSPRTFTIALRPAGSAVAVSAFGWASLNSPIR